MFRQRREAAAQRLPLTRNYRSRPEVLAAVNHLFGDEFGDGYQPLAASGEFPDPVFGHPVELLVTDKRSYREAGAHWRDGEAKRDRAARARARRRGRRGSGRDRPALRRRHRRRAVRGGAARARACRRTARPGGATSASSRSSTCSRTCACCTTATTTRRSSTVLASPFVGVSNDALVLHPSPRRQAAALHRDRALAARALCRGRRAAGPRVQAALRAARRGVGAHWRSSGCARRSSRRTTTTSRCSRSWDGKRRYANLRKLMRLARSYEELRGAGHRGLRRRSSATRRRSARRSSRRCRRRRAPTRCGC